MKHHGKTWLSRVGNNMFAFCAAHLVPSMGKSGLLAVTHLMPRNRRLPVLVSKICQYFLLVIRDTGSAHVAQSVESRPEYLLLTLGVWQLKAQFAWWLTESLHSAQVRESGPLICKLFGSGSIIRLIYDCPAVQEEAPP
jgi:hypothetical protein